MCIPFSKKKKTRDLEKQDSKLVSFILLLHLFFSRHFCIDSISLRWWLQKVYRRILRQLVLFRPVTNGIEVLAPVLSVEVNVRLRAFGIDPDLTQNSTVDCAHELLAKNIEAMGWDESG